MNEELLKLSYSTFDTDASYEDFKREIVSNEELQRMAYSNFDTEASYDDFLLELGVKKKVPTTGQETTSEEKSTPSPQELPQNTPLSQEEIDKVIKEEEKEPTSVEPYEAPKENLGVEQIIPQETKEDIEAANKDPYKTFLANKRITPEIELNALESSLNTIESELKTIPRVIPNYKTEGGLSQEELNNQKKRYELIQKKGQLEASLSKAKVDNNDLYYYQNGGRYTFNGESMSRSQFYKKIQSNEFEDILNENKDFSTNIENDDFMTGLLNAQVEAGKRSESERLLSSTAAVALDIFDRPIKQRFAEIATLVAGEENAAKFVSAMTTDLSAMIALELAKQKGGDVESNFLQEYGMLLKKDVEEVRGLQIAKQEDVIDRFQKGDISGGVKDAFKMAFESSPFLGAAMIPYVGTSLIYNSVQSNGYRDLIEQGVDKDRAMVASNLSALAETADAIVSKALFKNSIKSITNTADKAKYRLGMSKEQVKEMKSAIVNNMTVEPSTEFAQGFTSSAINQWAVDGNIDYEKAFRDGAIESIAGLGTSLIMSSPVAAKFAYAPLQRRLDVAKTEKAISDIILRQSGVESEVDRKALKEQSRELVNDYIEMQNKSDMTAAKATKSEDAAIKELTVKQGILEKSIESSNITNETRELLKGKLQGIEKQRSDIIERIEDRGIFEQGKPTVRKNQSIIIDGAVPNELEGVEPVMKSTVIEDGQEVVRNIYLGSDLINNGLANDANPTKKEEVSEQKENIGVQPAQEKKENVNATKKTTEQAEVKEEVEIKLGDKGGILNQVKDWAKRNLYSQRNNKREEIYQANKDRLGEISSQLKIVENTSKDLRRISKKEGASETDINAVLRGEVDASILPEKTAEVVKSMRNQIDNLTRRAIKLGLVPDKMIPTYEENIGSYLTRSFRAFDDSNWVKKVPKEVKARAFNFIKNEIKEKATREILEQNPNMNESEIDEAINNRVVNRMEELLDKETSFVAAVSNLSSKDLSVLKKRKDIAEPIRALLGEYTDPIQNYAKSVFKMANFVANGRFLNDLKDAGNGVFIFEENDPKRPQGFNKKIAAEGSEVLSPLNGMYTSEEIYNQLKIAPETVPYWLGLWLKGMSTVKYTKTILSFTTHIKNVLGNIGFILMNGNININDWGAAVKVVLEGNGFTKKGSRWKLENSVRFREKYAEYQRLGVVSQSAGIGEIRDLINQSDIDNFIFQRKGRGRLERFWNKIKRGARSVENMYQAEDDFFKVVAFESEMTKRSEILLEKQKEDLTKEEYNKLSKEVADIIRDTYPTYDMVPEIVNVIKKFPLFGTFVSFEAESIRVLKNLIRIAYKESHSDDPKLNKLGNQRWAGITSYIALKYGVMAGFAYYFGISGDEDDDMRYFVPTWMKNGDLIYLGGDNGKFVVLDLSSSDPFGSTSSALNVMREFAEEVAEDPSNSKNIANAFVDAISEQFSTFVSEDILTARIREFASNKNSHGKAVYNPDDKPEKVLSDVISHFYDVFEPGSISSLKRYFDPKKDLKRELAASLLGLRAYDIDVKKEFIYLARDFNDRLVEAKKPYTSISYDENATEEDLQKEYDRANEKIISILNEMKDVYDAAERLGVKSKDLNTVMTDVRLSNKYKSQIKSGKIKEKQDIKPKSYAEEELGTKFELSISK